MDCREFKTRLETEETLSVPAALSEHAARCPACAKLLAAQERLRIGIEINRRAVRPPDLSPRIMERIARQKPEQSDEPGLIERLVALISPNTPIRSMVYYGAAGLIIFALSHAVIERAVELRRQKAAPVAWTLVSSRGALTLPAGAEVGRPIPSDTTITCEKDAEGRFAFGSFCRIQLHSARATLASGAVHIESGVLEAELTRGPGDAQMRFSTPHAEIMDIGTRFTVTVADGSSTIDLQDGRLRVTSTADRQSRDMIVPGRLTIQTSGFSKPDTPIPSPASASTPDSPEFHRQQAPEE
ncbi:MAG TPA: hypothetical protein PLP29_10215 [Candidatus Ozemobacteraceae bacterium]|nr:hypothetical protein [Candidatus Ozemobacteraceae bacterium]